MPAAPGEGGQGSVALRPSEDSPAPAPPEPAQPRLSIPCSPQPTSPALAHGEERWRPEWERTSSHLRDQPAKDLMETVALDTRPQRLPYGPYGLSTPCTVHRKPALQMQPCPSFPTSEGLRICRAGGAAPAITASAPANGLEQLVPSPGWLLKGTMPRSIRANPRPACSFSSLFPRAHKS